MANWSMWNFNIILNGIYSGNVLLILLLVLFVLNISANIFYFTREDINIDLLYNLRRFYEVLILLNGLRWIYFPFVQPTHGMTVETLNTDFTRLLLQSIGLSLVWIVGDLLIYFTTILQLTIRKRSKRA